MPNEQHYYCLVTSLEELNEWTFNDFALKSQAVNALTRDGSLILVYTGYDLEERVVDYMLEHTTSLLSRLNSLSYEFFNFKQRVIELAREAEL